MLSLVRTVTKTVVPKLEFLDDLEDKSLKKNSFELFDMLNCSFFITLCSQNGQEHYRDLAANAAIFYSITVLFGKHYLLMC